MLLQRGEVWKLEPPQIAAYNHGDRLWAIVSHNCLKIVREAPGTKRWGGGGGVPSLYF